MKKIPGLGEERPGWAIFHQSPRPRISPHPNHVSPSSLAPKATARIGSHHVRLEREPKDAL
jgi:hypothetical protein